MQSIDPRSLDSFTQAAFHPELTESEKRIRDAFVREYLEDYSHINAAIRVGFMKSFAEDYANKFMAEPYVQQKIRELELDAGIKDDNDRDRRLVLATLKREMQYRGAGSAHSARVSAAAQLAKLLGMEPALKTKTEVSVTTPVQFYLPHNGRDPLPVPTEQK